MTANAAPRVEIREATAGDADAIATVHAASVRELGSEAYTDEQLRAWLANVHPERYPLEEEGFRIAVAEADCEDGDRDGDGEAGDSDTEPAIVGFGLLDLDPAGFDEPIGKVGAVYVRPDRVREGLGSAILADLEATAREAGLERLVLTASKNAIEFYERRGYDGVETVSLEMRDDVALACLRMRRRLNSG